MKPTTLVFLFIVFFPAPARTQGLRDIAAASHLTFGCAVSVFDLQNDPDYAEAVARECGTVTPIHGAKMDTIAAQPGVLDFSQMDYLATFAAAHNQGLRLHSLEWFVKVPSFIRGYGWWDLLVWLATYSYSVAAHYPELLSIDTVNETVSSDLPPGTHNFWFDSLGENAAMAGAFLGAHWTGTKAVLLLSDWGLEDDAAKQAEFLALLKRNLGLPITGVGMQSHLWRPVNHEQFLSFVHQIQALGLRVEISELTVQTENQWEATAILSDYISLARRAGITDFTTWGLSRAYTKNSWKFSMPLDARMRPTPAWRALQVAMQ